MSSGWVTAGATAAGAAFVVVQIGIALYRGRKRYERQRRETTINTYLQTLDRRDRLRAPLPDDRDAAAVARLTDELLADPNNVDDDLKAKRRALAEYLTYWEALALGVQQEVFDFETINRQAGGHLMAISENWARWIESRRVLHGPTLYVGIEEVAREIKKARDEDR